MPLNKFNGVDETLKKKKIFIIISFFIILVPVISVGKYYQKINNIKIGFKLAEPIIEIKSNQNIIKKDIINGEKVDEFYFDVMNYKKGENTIISEIKFSYNIEIQSSNKNALVECKLYDCKTGEELLKGNNITNSIIVDKNIEYENKYKLVINVNNQKITKAEQVSIDILLNAIQEN